MRIFSHVLVFLMACVTAQAAHESGVSWELGPEIYYSRYEESDFDLVTDGAMYGAAGSYTYQDPMHWLVKAEGRAAAGEVDYESAPSGTIDGITDYTFEGRVSGGYHFDIWNDWWAAPYVGVGYRYLNDDSSGMRSSVGHGGYERESNYFYSPLGVEFGAHPKGDWDVKFIVEYDIFWSGEQKSHLGDAIASLGTVTNDQNDGYGMRGAVQFRKKGATFDMTIEPFVRYWDIDDSELSNLVASGVVVGYAYEPQNETLEAGAKVLFNF